MLSDQFVSSWEELVNFDRLRRYRVDRVTREMKEAGIDGLLLFKSDSIRYVTSLRPLIWEAGYQTRNMAILDASGNICLYVASGDYQRVVQNDTWLKIVKPLASMEDAGISSRVVNDQIVPQVREMGLADGRLAVDSTTFYTLQYLRDALARDESELEDGDEVMRKARAIKSSDEIRLIRGAAGMVDGGLSEAKAAIAPGRTENEVAGAALRAVYALGTEWMPINPAVFSGGGPVRRFATDRRIRRGDSVVVNLSTMNDGYCAEATRTFGPGKKSPTLASLSGSLRGAFDTVVSLLRPGTSISELFSTFSKALGSERRTTEIGLCVRGAGLSLTDLPLANNNDDEEAGRQGRKLEENMVIVLEARAERHPRDRSGSVGIQHSDTIHIGASGPSFMTRFQEDSQER